MCSSSLAHAHPTNSTLLLAAHFDRRYCLELTVIQEGSMGEREIVFKQLMTQAELQHLVPKKIGFIRFEHVDLENDNVVRHMRSWLPHIARRVVVKKGKVGENEARFNRDLALVKKLKFERTLYRTCGRVSWGPLWRDWWVCFYIQVEVRLDECRLLLSGFSKDKRHPGVHKMWVSCRQMTNVLGFHNKIDWREFLEKKDEEVRKHKGERSERKEAYI